MKEHSRRHRFASGFTIVELLIVVVVIAILAAITLVAFNNVTNRAKASAAASAAQQAFKKVAVYTVDNADQLPPDLATAGITNQNGTSYQYRTYNSGKNYCITATANSISSYIDNDTHQSPTPGACAGHGENGVAAVTNLVPNPSFETGLTGWGNPTGAGYTVSTSTAQALYGASSVSMVGASVGADRYVEITPYINAVAGTTYIVSAYAYLTSTNTTYANGDVMFNMGTGAATYPDGTLAYNRSKLNQWQRISGRIQVTANGTLRVRFCIPVNSTTYIDGVMVTATPTLQNYADGSSPGWIWNGTANNSTSTGSATAP